jgi:hypothetical protein
MKNLNQTPYHRNILVCGNTGRDIDEVETTEKDSEEEIISDTFPVWKEAQYKRSQHPGFC